MVLPICNNWWKTQAAPASGVSVQGRPVCMCRCLGSGFFDAVDVGAVAGVDFDGLAFVDEEGHAHRGARLDGGGLGGVGGGVAFEARLGVGDFQARLDGHFGVEDRVGRCVDDHVDDVAFLHEVDSGDEVFGDGDVVPCLLVEEVVIVALSVGVLEGAALDAYVFDGLADVESFFEDASGDDVFQLRAHDGVSLSGFHVEELDAEVELAVHTDAGAVLDVLRFDHIVGC